MTSVAGEHGPHRLGDAARTDRHGREVLGLEEATERRLLLRGGEDAVDDLGGAVAARRQHPGRGAGRDATREGEGGRDHDHLPPAAGSTAPHGPAALHRGSRPHWPFTDQCQGSEGRLTRPKRPALAASHSKQGSDRVSDQRAVAVEVDGEAPLVHGAAGAGRGRRALRRRHLVDGVVAGPAVLPAQLDLPLRRPVAAPGEGEAVRLGGGEQRVDLFGDRGVDRDAAHRDEVEALRPAGRHRGPLLGGVRPDGRLDGALVEADHVAAVVDAEGQRARSAGDRHGRVPGRVRGRAAEAAGPGQHEVVGRVADDLAAVVDARRDRGDGTGGADRGVLLAGQQEPAGDAGVVEEHAHDLAVVVDVHRRGRAATDQVDRGEPTVPPDEPVRLVALVHVVPDHVAGVVDAGRPRVPRAGDVEPRDRAPGVPHEAAHASAVVDQPGVLAVPADDLAGVVDLGRLGGPGTRHGERGEPALRVADETRLAVAADVLTRDLAGVVDPGRVDRRVGLGCLERRELAAAQDERRQRAGPRLGPAGEIVLLRAHRRRPGGDQADRHGEREEHAGGRPSPTAAQLRWCAAGPGHDGFPPGRAARPLPGGSSEPSAGPDLRPGDDFVFTPWPTASTPRRASGRPASRASRSRPSPS